jgi:quercetin dioxygenase-like cupin family protein
MDESSDTGLTAQPLCYTRIYPDAEGNSHFSDEEMPFKLVDFAPPSPGISVSDPTRAESVCVISSPAGWYGDWHPAPRRQRMFCLAGELEVQVSDGEIRRFEAGTVVQVEDTTGRGHTSRVVGSGRVYLATVFLPDE